MRKLLTVLLIIFLIFSIQSETFSLATTTEANTPADVSKLKGLDKFIEKVMKEWKIPGLAIAVVKDGEVILSKGYGYRDLEKKLPVTPKTLFAIGSVTKSFTVTALGMLVDEGKLEWDTAVREYLPDFRLQDPVATDHMTPHDLVTHRSGLPRHDLLWYGSKFTRKELFARLRYLEPSKEFRSVFQYQNLMFMTAGYLVGQISGVKWEDFVKQRILVPLDMNRSNFSVNDSKKSEDFALPYVKAKEEVKLVPFRNIDEVGPAGSINSCVEEMIRYVQFHVNKGKHGETQLLSENNAEQMYTPQMVIPGAIRYDELAHSSYGMGLGVTYYQGQKVVQHGGGIDGFISLLSFMPGKKIGMIVLTNLSGNNPVPTIVVRNVYDRLLGLKQVDWVARIKEQQKKAKEAEEKAKKEAYTTRKEGTSPSHILADYTGTYEHPGYGTIKVARKNEQLVLTFNEFSGPLKHFHYDIFEMAEDPLNPLEKTKVTFLYNKKGEIDRLTIPLDSNVDDIIFTRATDESMRQKSFLEQFVGVYEIGPQTITIALKGVDTLTMTVPGQPTYTLVPTHGTSFDLKGLNGFSVEFKKNAAGVGTELVSHQPNGSFVAKKK